MKRPLSTVSTLLSISVATGMLLALLVDGPSAIPLAIVASASSVALLLGVTGLRGLSHRREPPVAPIHRRPAGEGAPGAAADPGDEATGASRSCADTEQVIRRAREAELWTQDELYERSGVSVRTIRRVESGERVHFETLRALAAALGMDGRRFAAASTESHPCGANAPDPALILLPSLRDLADSPAPVIAIITAQGATDVAVGPDRPGITHAPDPGSPAEAILRTLGVRPYGRLPEALGREAEPGPYGTLRLADGRWAALAELAPASRGESDDARLPEILDSLASPPLAIVRRFRPLPRSVALASIHCARQMTAMAFNGSELHCELTATAEMIDEGTVQLVRHRVDLWFAGATPEDAVAAAESAVVAARAAGCRLTRVRHSVISHWPGRGWVGQPAASGHMLAHDLLRASGHHPGPVHWLTARPLLFGVPIPVAGLSVAALLLCAMIGALAAFPLSLCLHVVLWAVTARDPWFDVRLAGAQPLRGSSRARSPQATA